jgi:D-alanyl-D-alanine carboxypeptidase/D-alanyl-D-alanine-endopeptidase (penicillin-binding protein 4)
MRLFVSSLLSLTVVASTAASLGAAGPPPLPHAISQVMHKPRYAKASWSLLVTDLATGKTIYALDADRMSFTGSVRKLFSVGVALNRLGAGHRFRTPVFRTGAVDPAGALSGDLILVAAGDLTFGGRLTPTGGVQFTDFDHNDANNLDTAILTPQDPLRGLNDLARQVRAAGIRSVSGDVVVDDRLFEAYRVPNGNLLISPILVNENMVDVSVTPARPGQPARVDWRPKTAAFSVSANVATVAAPKPDAVTLSDKGLVDCVGSSGCNGTVAGTIPAGYKAPLSGSTTFVRTFRIEDPPSFARIAFIQALQRAGVTVRAPLLQPNATEKLTGLTLQPADRIGEFVSPPYAEAAKLILKVSLNLGANLSLSLFGVDNDARTIDGALASERKTLVGMGVAADEFAFPTNGSGSPDSQAAPRAVVQLLSAMAKGPNAGPYHAGLPVLGVDGSLAGTGTKLPAKGHVFAKTGTTLDATGLKAQTLAGYIDAKSGRKLAFALFVNNAGPVKQLEDVAEVFADEATITNVIYGSN